MTAHNIVARLAYGDHRPTGEGRRGSVPPARPDLQAGGSAAYQGVPPRHAEPVAPVSASERELMTGYRNTRRGCLCHGDRLPWWDWTAGQWATFERQQRQAAMATIAAERTAEREERTA